MVRNIAEGLYNLGDRYVVKNMPGDQGLIGLEFVARSPSDGRTYGLLDAGAFGYARKSNNLNPISGVKPVSIIGITGNVIVVGESFPARTVAELIEIGKTKGVSLGTGGENSLSHSCIKQFAQSAGISPLNITHYKGMGPLLADQLRGSVGVSCVPIIASRPFIVSSKLRAIGVTLPDSHPLLPNVPSLERVGIQGVPIGNWFMLVMPRDATVELANPLVSNLKRVFADSVFISRSRSLGVDLIIPAADVGPEIADAFLRRRMAEPNF